MTASQRPPLPPFDEASALQKVRMAEDAWNSQDPEKVSLAYTPDSVWRNRSEFISGRDSMVNFFAAEMVQGTGISPGKRTVGLYWQSNCSPRCLRIDG